MDLEEYNKELEKRIKMIRDKEVEKVVFPAGVRLLARIKNRIQQEGRKSDGTPIGSYSQKPMYASRKQFILKSAFKPQGKNPAKRGGKKHKTMYLPFGYYQLRQIQGRPVKHKNYTYSGSLMASYTIYKDTEAVLLGINNQKSVDIKRRLQNKDGKTFYATEQEKKEYDLEVQQQLKIISNQLLARFNVQK